MTVKKLVRRVHLWLGLLSGIIVMVVCLTGAIWAFHLHGWIGGARLEIPGNGAVLPPSVLAEMSKDSLKGKMPSYISYTKNEPASIGVYGRGARITLTIDPYTGKVLNLSEFNRKPGTDEKFDFWNFIRRGHRALWLPWEIGRPVVNYGTLVFAVVLVSGVFLWWPRTRKAFRTRTWFRWEKVKGLQRKIFDLHIISGFYVSLILMAIALSGMVWGIEWYSKGLYKLTTGGKELPGWGIEKSDTANAGKNDPLCAVDEIFVRMTKLYPNAASMYIDFPDTTKAQSVIRANIYRERGKYYNRDCFVFDRYTLKEIQTAGPYSGRYEDAGIGEKLRRMNYDIHIGSIWGLPGKILAVAAALIGASLPVTGAYMYFRKRRKRKKE